VTRGEQLRELIALGCSGRGLADDLCVSPTNIRFHLDLAEITPTEKQALKAGGSAKQAFETLQRRREAEAEWTEFAASKRPQLSAISWLRTS
jgi:hypothetical protein